MASRPAFYFDGKFVSVKNVEFQFSSGFSATQKQKNIKKIHEKLAGEALEVSTKSLQPLGKKFSAFVLKLDGHYLENIFQASKLFEHGGPYIDLLNVSPKLAKTDARLKLSGKLVMFTYKRVNFNLEPKTSFYDYIYYNGVRESVALEDVAELLKYKYFTDIEFNPNRSINTQAEAIVIVQYVYAKYGRLPEFSKDEFLKIHKQIIV